MWTVWIEEKSVIFFNVIIFNIRLETAEKTSEKKNEEEGLPEAVASIMLEIIKNSQADIMSLRKETAAKAVTVP